MSMHVVTISHMPSVLKLIYKIHSHCHAPFDIAKVRRCGVRFTRRHVAYDLATIQADPIERCVWEVVDVVPAQLLCEEACHTCQSAELWQLARVAEGVWQPEGCA